MGRKQKWNSMGWWSEYGSSSMEFGNRLKKAVGGCMEHSDVKIDRDYKIMLAILDYCYNLDQNDYLGILLGVLSLDIGGDNLPSDLADYEMWKECVEMKIEEDIVTKILCFLERFIVEYNFKLESTISILTSLDKQQIDELIQFID